ncbi:MAG: ribonuclease HII [Hyphomicrobiales bacterium]
MTSKSKTNSGPNFFYEEEAMAAGHSLIAGVDEVGRGPLAGPVVTAAVILKEGQIPEGLNDSKKLTEKRREILFEEIFASAQIAISSVSAEQIDQMNIRAATLYAMVEAVEALNQQPTFVLIDGRDIPPALKQPAKAIIKGDAHSLSIAAASIVAKVTRDRMMVRANTYYPGYDFDHHKGYGSKAHRDAIAKLGPCPLHRRSFQPIKSMVS